MKMLTKASPEHEHLRRTAWIICADAPRRLGPVVAVEGEDGRLTCSYCGRTVKAALVWIRQ